MPISQYLFRIQSAFFWLTALYDNVTRLMAILIIYDEVLTSKFVHLKLLQ